MPASSAPASKFVDIAAERLQRIIAVNTVGAFLAAQEAVRRMSTRLGGKGGVIVNMSSIAAKLGGSNEATDYAASKGAIDTLTVGLAKEVATEGIRVNAVRPGLIYTDIHASIGDPDRVDRLKTLVPMQRGGTAEEVAEAVLWLCSDSPPIAPANCSMLPAAGGCNGVIRNRAANIRDRALRQPCIAWVPDLMPLLSFRDDRVASSSAGHASP